MAKWAATTQKPYDVQWICYFGKSFLMSSVSVLFLLLLFVVCLVFFFFSSLVSSASDFWCICYLVKFMYKLFCKVCFPWLLLTEFLKSSLKKYVMIYFRLILACYCSIQKRQLCFVLCSYILTIASQKRNLENCKVWKNSMENIANKLSLVLKYIFL